LNNEKENLNVIKSENENIIKKLKIDMESKETLLNRAQLENDSLKKKFQDISRDNEKFKSLVAELENVKKSINTSYLHNMSRFDREK